MGCSFLRELKLLGNFMEFGGLSQTFYRPLFFRFSRVRLFARLLMLSFSGEDDSENA